MIDFRFFIISIVAVFLALGLGIVVGSGLLRDPLLSTLERRIEDTLDREGSLREDVLELEDVRDAQREVLELLEPSVVDETLAGEQIVLFEVEGTDSELVEGLEQVVREAGGTIGMRIRLNDKLRLDDGQAVEQLAGAVDSISPNPSALRSDLGLELGARLGQAATPPARLDSNRDRSQVRARTFLSALEEDGFVSFDEGQPPDMPQNARFLLVAGATAEPPWPVEETMEPLGFSLASEELAVVVAETEASQWAVTQAVRDDALTSDVVTTIDNADTVPGRIGTALGLSLAPVTTGHWGNDEGAVAPVPTPPG